MEPNIDNSLNAGSVPVQPQAATPVASAPQLASDTDLIEEAWINAVRHAVAANSSDPHAMNDSVASLRREYLQRRYGKSVETDK